MASVAATLANGGVHPTTNEYVWLDLSSQHVYSPRDGGDVFVCVFSSIFSPITVRNTMSLMFSCGMYDYSGGAIQPMPFSLSLSLPVTSDRSTAVDSLSRDLQSLRTPSACPPSPVSPAASLLSCPT